MKTLEQIRKEVLIDISMLQLGDTVIHEGKERTLTKSNLKRDSFIGTTVYGDSYNLGHKPVTRIIYEVKKC